jgi:FixJ family two-component response regulator
MASRKGHLASVPLIAIVDDDDAIRIAAASLIRSLGLRARSFASAEEFLGSETLEETACLVTDVHMPGISGLELQDVLRARGQKMPIIFITAYPEEAIHMRARAAGAAAVFLKPFDGQNLSDCVMGVLRKEGRL